LAALIRGARAVIASSGDPTTSSFVSDWPHAVTATRRLAPSALPVLRWIAMCEPLAGPAMRTFVHEVVAASASLAWRQTYGTDDFGADFLQRYGWSELIGLRGPVRSRRIAVGLLLLGPDVEYGLHSHAAEEAYFPLAGAAHWKRGDDDWTLREPGTSVYHASWMPHAMRTREEPLLALYAWRGGDLAQKSKIL
jgi:mannose-6-phosphate isomerase-like protein (cupin superfamily)